MSESTNDKKVQLYDRCDPALDSGEAYRVEVSQSVGPLLTSSGSVHLRVVGPSVRLQPADIVGVYPAPGSEDSPPEFLPHVALARRTLPWERKGPAGDHPWLALLVFEDGELKSHEGGPIRKATVADLAEEIPELHASITDELPGDTPVDLIDLPDAHIDDILPQERELPLLCHMRRLLTEGGPMFELDDDGDVAIVIANRLPQDSDKLHHAVLVSLEGRAGLLPKPGVARAKQRSGAAKRVLRSGTSFRLANDSLRSAATRTQLTRRATATSTATAGRAKLDAEVAKQVGDAAMSYLKTTPLLVLHHWSFTPAKNKGDFESVVQKLRHRGGVLRYGSLPRTERGGELGTMVDDKGFIDGELEFAQVEGGRARYRGPLCPLPPGLRPDGFAIRAKPEELENAEGEAMDLSRLAPFELGRLLALSDPGVLAALRNVAWQVEIVEFEEIREQDPRPEILRMPEAVTNPSPGEQWAPQVDRFGESLLDMAKIGHPANVADVAGVRELSQRIEDELGGLSQLVEQLGGELEEALPGGLHDFNELSEEMLETIHLDLITAQKS